jgi:hypothetical protein
VKGSCFFEYVGDDKRSINDSSGSDTLPSALVSIAMTPYPFFCLSSVGKISELFSTETNSLSLESSAGISLNIADILSYASYEKVAPVGPRKTIEELIFFFMINVCLIKIV